MMEAQRIKILEWRYDEGIKNWRYWNPPLILYSFDINVVNSLNVVKCSNLAFSKYIQVVRLGSAFKIKHQTSESTSLKATFVLFWKFVKEDTILLA